jgi:hypothetical protein
MQRFFSYGSRIKKGGTLTDLETGMPVVETVRFRGTLGGPHRALPTFLGATLVFSACSANDIPQTDRWRGRVDTLESGEIHVANPEEGLWAEADIPQVEEDLRIGASDGGDPATFGAVSSFEVDHEGRIWVLDGHSQEIRVFAKDGRFVRTVGKNGEGPGEFNMATGMSWSPQGNLWVLDPGTLRFSVLDSSGTFLGSQRVAGGTLIIPWPGGFDRHGRLLHYDRRTREVGGVFDMVIVRYDADMNPTDTLEIPRLESPASFELRAGLRYMSVPVPFAPSPVWHLSPLGDIWWSNGADYSIRRSGPDGNPVFTISKESSPTPVSDKDIEMAIAGLEQFTDAGGRIDFRRIPGEKPALSDFFFDDRDRIWVIPYGEMVQARPTLDVFDHEGRFLGHVEIPFRFKTTPTPIVRSGAFYAVTTDELDVPFIVRGRFKEGAP